MVNRLFAEAVGWKQGCSSAGSHDLLVSAPGRLQALSRVLPLRVFFLLPQNYSSCKSVLVQRFGALLRKTWNPRQFKGQVRLLRHVQACLSASPFPMHHWMNCHMVDSVPSAALCQIRALTCSWATEACLEKMRGVQVSPHEFMQQVMAASSKRFIIEKKSDPVEFLSWLLNTIHSDLTGGKRKKPSIISKCFQVLMTQSSLQYFPFLGCSGYQAPSMAMSHRHVALSVC